MLLAMYSIFAFVFIGYLANILRLVGNKQSGILLGFLVNFALPAQIFNGTYHANVSLNFLLVCLVALFVNCAAGMFALLIGKLFRLERSTLITICFMAMLGNTVFALSYNKSTFKNLGIDNLHVDKLNNDGIVYD